METINKHHIWCNKFLDGPASECEMCKSLYHSYPPLEYTEEELMAIYFPDNRIFKEVED